MSKGRWLGLEILVEIVQQLLSDVPVIRVSGDLDHLHVAALETAFQTRLAASDHRFVLDLSDCSYIDSGGLAAIMTTAGELRDDGLLAIVAPSVTIHRLLDLVGLSENMRCAIVKTEKEALAAVAPASQGRVL